MKSHEPMDDVLRRSLKRHPAPAFAATLTDDILRRVTSHESIRRQRIRRALMIVYWVAVGVGSWWALHSLPLPAWTPESLSPALTWLIPCAGALLVWRWPIVRWLTSSFTRSTS